MSPSFLCYICKKDFGSWRLLRNHCERVHVHDQSFTYRCTASGCQRTYGLFQCYKRHYLRDHMSITKNSLVKEISEVTSVNENVTNKTTFQNVCASESSSSDVNIWTVTDLNDYSDKPNLSSIYGTFIAELYADCNLPRSVLQKIVTGISGIVNAGILPSIIQSCQMSLSGLVSEELQQNVSSQIISNLEIPLKNFTTEHKRLQYFREHGFDFVKKFGKYQLTSVKCVEHFIPLRDVLKKFFSLESILFETLQYIDQLKSDNDVIRNFIQGEYWKNRQINHIDRLVFPLFLFWDEYQVGNVLGSHTNSQKIGAVYVSVPCLPSNRASSLSSIFLTLLFHSSDRNQFGNHMIFKPVIDELNHLQEVGVEIDIPGFKNKLYFELAVILGDNLGLHSMLGFVESFRSNFPCRTCCVRKDILAKQCYEDTTLLRTSESYQNNLIQNAPSLSGVKEKCVWTNVQNFVLFDQTGVDVMHDVLEGVAKYTMSFIILKLIRDFKYFTLSILNDKIVSFAYGPDSNHKPIPLTMENLAQGNIKLSAAEMLAFLRYFGIMVGDLVPKHCYVWALYR